MTRNDFTYRAHDDHPLWATSIGAGPAVILLHGGGPDHHSLLPLARRLADHHTVTLPDIRGYGRSICTDPTLHTWNRYTDDVIALLDHLDVEHAVLGGTGLGGTITLRTALAHPHRITAAIAIGVEDIEDDQAKQAETTLLDAFAHRALTQGLESAWAPLLPLFPPLIGTLVRDAIPRSDPPSIAAAAAIGRDRSFRSVTDLAQITTPTLIVPGTDERHPTALGEQVAHTLPRGRLATVAVSTDLHTAEDLAERVAPHIRAFLDDTIEYRHTPGPVTATSRSQRQDNRPAT